MRDRNLQKDFQQLLKDIFLHHFKPLGFEHAGSTFRRIDNEGFIQEVNAQKNRYNNAESVSFTFNIYFCSNADQFALPWQSERPTPLFLCRLEQLDPGPSWYYLQHDVPMEDIRDTVSDRMARYVVPLYESIKTPRALLELMRFMDKKEKPTNVLMRFVFLYQIGEHAEAIALLKADYASIKANSAIPPQAMACYVRAAHHYGIKLVDEPELSERLAFFDEHMKRLEIAAAERRAVWEGKQQAKGRVKT